jgi:hypothetical protein
MDMICVLLLVSLPLMLLALSEPVLLGSDRGLDGVQEA